MHQIKQNCWIKQYVDVTWYNFPKPYLSKDNPSKLMCKVLGFQPLITTLIGLTSNVGMLQSDIDTYSKHKC